MNKAFLKINFNFVAGALSLLIVLILALSGCNSSNNPVSSGFPSGEGYRINVAAAQRTIVPGGVTILTAHILTPTGASIPDNEKVLVSSHLGGTLKDLRSKESSETSSSLCTGISAQGTVVMSYSPPGTATENYTEAYSGTSISQSSRNELITFAYQGAISTIELEIVAKDF